MKKCSSAVADIAFTDKKRCIISKIVCHDSPLEGE
jgi:hypothetical protein